MQNKETIERIRALATRGWSRGEIARQLGLTRSSVIGILWRLAHPDAERMRPKHKHKRNRRVGRPPLPEAIAKPEPHVYKPIKVIPVVLPETRPRLDPRPRVGAPLKVVTCCWHQCMAPPVERGKPYCEKHARA